MKKNIFEYDSYKKYLTDFIKSRPSKGHGFRTEIANAMNCRAAFVSQVLNSEAHFSLEQAEAVNSLLGHTMEESDYFLLIVQFERAGSHGLKIRLKKQIDRSIEKRQVLKERVDIKQTLTIQDQATYYSHWYYATIHMLVTIEKFQTKESIADYTRLPLEKVSTVLEFFIHTGLVKFENGKYKPGLSRLFLGADSPLIAKHHTNWRLQALQSLDRDLNSDLHFSGIVSLASQDISKTKEELIRGLESARTIVRESPREEEIYCIGIDFFKV